MASNPVCETCGSDLVVTFNGAYLAKDWHGEIPDIDARVVCLKCNKVSTRYWAAPEFEGWPTTFQVIDRFEGQPEVQEQPDLSGVY